MMVGTTLKKRKNYCTILKITDAFPFEKEEAGSRPFRSIKRDPSFNLNIICL